MTDRQEGEGGRRRYLILGRIMAYTISIFFIIVEWLPGCAWVYVVVLMGREIKSWLVGDGRRDWLHGKCV